MNIKYSSSCTGEGLYINEESFSDMTPEDQKTIVIDIIDEIFEKCKFFYMDGVVRLLQSLQPASEYLDTEPCSCCGHHYESAEWEI